MFLSAVFVDEQLNRILLLKSTELFWLAGRFNVTTGTVTSLTVKYVVSVALILPAVSFAKNVILYCPVNAGIVKLALYLSPIALLKSSNSTVVFG